MNAERWEALLDEHEFSLRVDRACTCGWKPRLNPATWTRADYRAHVAEVIAREVADLIAAAEQRGREDNADHGMCYAHGSKALAALIAREAGEREARLRERIEALADDGSRLGTSGRLLIWPDELRAVLDQGDEECA